jgi:PAS domain S-box-containing protein
MTGSQVPQSDNTKLELLELIIESSTDFGIFTIDPSGLVTTWNVGAERLFGFSESEVVGTSADVIFVPEDRAAGAPEKERAQALANGRAIDERWHQRQDGSRFWASGLMMPLKNPQLGFVKITRDLTERHRSQERLRENEERFRLLATSVPQLVFLTRPDGDRTWGSPQWIEFTGLSLEESLGFGWMDAIHPDDREATQNAWKAAQREGEYYVEHRVRRERDGAYLWHQTRAKPIASETAESKDWVGTMTDIDALRGLQGRQRVLMAELQHRTRNLLAVVQSIASQTVRSSSSIEDFRPRFEGRLQSLGRVQNLLSRAETDLVDLTDLITAELSAHARNGQSRKLSLSGAKVRLSASAAQTLALALHELTTNAVKYGAFAQPQGLLDISWAMDSGNPERELVLKWRESGVAMPRPAKQRKGYGSELIERALPYQLGAKTKLVFREDGVQCTICIPASAGLEASDG